MRRGRWRASACRRRRSRSRRSRASSSARRERPSADARSSTPATCATRDLAIEVPRVAARGGDVRRGVGSRSTTGSPSWSREHRTTLVFVNTRRMAERVARHLAERLGEEHVAAHHGSLSREQRLDAEQRLKGGELQGAGRHRLARARHRHRRRRPGVPARLAALDRRRSCSASAAPGHAVGGMPKGRLFPLTRDELVECAALLDAVRARRARPRCACREQPLDVLAQQIVAEVACAGMERGRAVRAACGARGRIAT